ncbi:OmpA family protein [Salidesulfovibrio onnuriiensis]|uniref:OmpA family protein n=1 Tax=Salidesulfovibrio onnuriiensis TaxID=2583823 RepID=UPI00164F62E9|nr:OmpA family protein [Salidesulfovibrio onnuriiensis]
MQRLLLFIIILSLGACAYVEPSITEPSTIYKDAKLHKSEVVMTAQPRSRQYQPLTALCMPFFIQEPVTDHIALGRELGGIFYRTWRYKQMFPIFEYASDSQFRGLGSALSLARAKGADLLIVGIIPHLYAGSTVDDTDITIQIRIYETRNNMLLFSMAQAGRVEFRDDKDLILLKVKDRMPSSPLYQLTRSIAHDMAVPVQSWLPSPGTPYQFADDRAGIVNAMTAPVQPAGNTADTAAGQQTGPQGDSGMDGAQGQQTDVTAIERDLKSPEAPGVNLDIHFDVDKATIRPSSYPLIDELGRALQSPDLKGRKVIIGGHTDSDANDRYNLDLSKRRAEAVKQYLTSKFQIDPALLTTVGYGESRPLAKNDNAANKQMNRRVEVRLAE